MLFLRKPTTMRLQQKDPILWSSAPNILWSIGEIYHLPIWPGCMLALARFSYSPKIQFFELPSFRTCLEASTRKTRTWMRGHRTKKQERLVWIHLSFPLFGCTWHGVSSRFYDLRNSHTCSYPTVCPFCILNPVRTIKVPVPPTCPCSHHPFIQQFYVPDQKITRARFSRKERPFYTNTIYYYVNIRSMLYAPASTCIHNSPLHFIFTPTKTWEGTPKWIAPRFTPVEL